MRECMCKGTGWVVAQRLQTALDAASGNYAPEDLVFTIRKCPGCVLASRPIPPPDDSRPLACVVGEGWCDLAERIVRRRKPIVYA